MEVNSDQVDISEKNDENVKSDKEITDLELEVKIETPDVAGNIKTEVFEEENNSESFQITGEKRKNNNKSDLVNKKVKDEFVVFEEFDYKQLPQQAEEINLGTSDNQVI